MVKLHACRELQRQRWVRLHRRDGAGATDAGHVNVTVTPANDPPVAIADSVTTQEDTAVTFNPAANDTDIDGDSLSVMSVGTPLSGTAVVNANGTVTYTPEANAYGTDTFAYTVGDGAGGSASGSISVQITAANDAPAALTRSRSRPTTRQPSTITITGADVETCDLTFTIVCQPAHGKLGNTSNKLCVTLLPPYSDGASVSYTPAAGYSGPDSFTYRTSDGQLTSGLQPSRSRSSLPSSFTSETSMVRGPCIDDMDGQGCHPGR